jgi:muramoyltetrapeptide carboxypeptidase
MDKRDFLRGAVITVAGAAVMQNTLYADTINTSQKTIVKPKRLRKGDRVALIAPGTNVTDPILIRKAEKTIESLGYVPVVHPTLVSDMVGYSTNTINKRVDAIHSSFLDSNIKGLWCIRGGYGSVDLIDKIDYAVIENNPKLFIGYSDITALHNAFIVKAGLATLHGPVAISEMNEYTLNILKLMLESGNSGIKIALDADLPSNTRYLSNFDKNVRGRLLGGNLSLLSSLCGSEYLPDFNGSIMYIEDVGEAPYRIHRMMKQLELSDNLSNKALLIGRCDDCSKGASHVSDYTESQAYLEVAERKNIPVSFGNHIGHTKHQATLPNGLNVEYNPKENTITLLEGFYSD